MLRRRWSRSSAEDRRVKRGDVSRCHLEPSTLLSSFQQAVCNITRREHDSRDDGTAQSIRVTESAWYIAGDDADPLPRIQNQGTKEDVKTHMDVRMDDTPGLKVTLFTHVSFLRTFHC